MIKQDIKFETGNVEYILELNPFLNHHRIVLDRFLRKFYKLFTKYKEDPNENRKIYIKRRFNSLFSPKTGYGELDTRIALTEKKEAELLLVLDHPHAQYCMGFPDPILQNRYREPVS